MIGAHECFVAQSAFVGANVEMAVLMSLLLLLPPEHLATVFTLVLSILLAGLITLVLVVLFDHAEGGAWRVRR